MAKLLIGVREAAAMVGLSRFTIAKMARLGRIKSIRVGRRMLFRVDEMEKLAKSGSPVGTKSLDEKSKAR